jgi:ech hydrogenase subunit A
LDPVYFLLLFPLLPAVVLFLVRNDKARTATVWASVLIVAAASVWMALRYYANEFALFDSHAWVGSGMMVLKALFAVAVVVYAVRRRRWAIVGLVVLQEAASLWFELAPGHEVEAPLNLYVDKLSLTMVLIVGVIGGLIVLYSVGYMRNYHQHHPEVKDRRPMFYFVVFVFLSAMFGIVTANNLQWMYFFWEVTTLCSFLLIGYTGTEEAKRYSERALGMNLLGGLAFVGAILYTGLTMRSIDLRNILQLGLSGWDIVIPVILLAFAGMVKSAQLPFSSWLLGAMVAPTPTSALLHSSTMVKAGVFLLLRLAPVLSGTAAGTMVILVGGITFLVGSIVSITHSDAKKVLAYSTVANLGLVVACAGVGTSEAVWAGFLLMIFHAIAKSLMFLSVGTIEHNLHSRDIEDMHGLLSKMPMMAILITIGIAGMFLAPFGMLISKWAAMKAFIDSNNVFIVLLLVFGSSATLFFWTKWLGKIVAVLNHIEPVDKNFTVEEVVSLVLHAGMTSLMCVMFPFVSKYLIEPYLFGVFGPAAAGTIISQGNITVMTLMLGMVVVIPAALYVFMRGRKERIVPAYMAGANTDDNRFFVDAHQEPKRMFLTNWYMEDFFKPTLLLKISGWVCTLVMLTVVALTLGGMLA